MPLSANQIPQDTWALRVKPGVKRDGTVFEEDYWTSCQWTRFQRGLPRSIGGYQRVVPGFNAISRGLYVFPNQGVNYVTSGWSDGVEVALTDASGFGGGTQDRTPAGFVADDDNVWQFDAMFNAGGSNTALIAHAAPNLNYIDSDVAMPVYYGDATATDALVTVGQSVSGGAVVLHPYLMIYGSDGQVAWSDANTPTNFATGDAGSARICENKIVKGLITRGGFYSPAGLLWSLTSLIRATFIGAPAIFRFDTISDQTSILSSSCVIEYDGLYFWIGIDRFLVFNGTVKEVPNNMNINYFFDNLNFAQRQKVWACKIPRYGEIWWFYPKGDATECNDAIIYNVREDTWYDAGLAPGAARSSGFYAQVFPQPLMMSNVLDEGGAVSLWKHETGANEVSDTVNAIRSFIDTCDISWCASGPDHQWTGRDVQVRLESMEPDFVMSAAMSITVFGRDFAQGTTLPMKTFPFTPSTDRIDMKQMVRQMRLRFESNIVNGAWQMGQPLLHWGVGDKRRN